SRGRRKFSSMQTVRVRRFGCLLLVTYAAADSMRVASPMGPEAAAGLPARSKWAAASRRHSIARVAIAAAGGAALLLAAVLSRWPTIKLSPTPDMAGALSVSQPSFTPRVSVVLLPLFHHAPTPPRQIFSTRL